LGQQRALGDGAIALGQALAFARHVDVGKQPAQLALQGLVAHASIPAQTAIDADAGHAPRELAGDGRDESRTRDELRHKAARRPSMVAPGSPAPSRHLPSLPGPSPSFARPRFPVLARKPSPPAAAPRSRAGFRTPCRSSPRTPTAPCSPTS